MVHRISSLIVKHLRSEITPAEEVELVTWVNESQENKTLFDEVTREEVIQEELTQLYTSREETWQKIETYLATETAEPVRRNRLLFIPVRKFWSYAAAAAVVMAVVGTFWWSQSTRKPAEQKTVVAQTADIQPGGNKATLTLEDGRSVLLDSASNGLLVEQGSSKVVKLQDGELVYSRETGSGSRGPVQYNVLNTPRGGQYQLTLPDGTRAWLNAASSIKYPTTFADDTERKVEITGEVYFEVSPLPASPGAGSAKGKLPFIVKVLNSQGVAAEVKVLGTHFNINAYVDEPVITTTLLEGKVQVTTEDTPLSTTGYRLLAPGQQAQINGDNIQVSKANTEAAVAWVHGQFIFPSVDIKTLLRQASRWYNIDVEYQSVPAYRFSGTISRTVTLAEFLEILKYSEVKFKIEGRKVIIQN